jgi:hypothetical protein
MPIQGLPTFTMPGAELSTMPDEIRDMLLKQAQQQKQQGENQREQQQQPLKMDELRQKIASEKALAELRNRSTGVGMGGGGGVDFKNMVALTRQAMLDNPGIDMNKANQIASAWLSGSDTLPDGTPVPKMSGMAQQALTNIQKKNAPAAVQTTAANMNILAKDVNDIDIGPLQRFAGLPGRLDLAQYQAKMTAGEDVPQEYRDYLSFQNVTSQFAMDALRKGFGTSVVPDYVYSTLGNASNPGSKWWHDPKQVAANWKRTTDWINSNAKRYANVAQHGLHSETVGGQSSGGQQAGSGQGGQKKVRKFKVVNNQLVEV